MTKNEKPYFLIGILAMLGKHKLSLKTINELKSRFNILNYSKGEIICSGSINADKLGFIRRGMVRGYVELNGKQITNWISIEDEFFASVNFFSENIFEEKIEAMEDLIIEYIDHDDYIDLLRFNDFQFLSQKLFQEYYVFANRRALISRIPNSTQRFKFFLTNYNKEIIIRCPNKYLASFLGIRAETLSRIMAKNLKNTHLNVTEL